MRLTYASATPRLGRGVTLVELLVVLAILGIVASVAYPAFLGQVRHSRRAAVEAFLMEVSARQQQRLLDARSYGDSLATLAMAVPSEVNNFYTIAVFTGAGPPPTFTLSATPKGTQAGDTCGTLFLTNTGVKLPLNCWR